MAFRHPIQNNFEAISGELNAQVHHHGLGGTMARTNFTLLRAFSQLMGAERDRNTQGAHFLHAVLAAVANILAGTMRYCIEPESQAEALGAVLALLREQIEPRLGKPSQEPVLFAGFMPKPATARASGE